MGPVNQSDRWDAVGTVNHSDQGHTLEHCQPVRQGVYTGTVNQSDRGHTVGHCQPARQLAHSGAPLGSQPYGDHTATVRRPCDSTCGEVAAYSLVVFE